MGNERIVVVKEQKRGGFWPFVGGLLLGAVVLKTYDNYQKSKKEKDSLDEPKTSQEYDIIAEIAVVEQMIDELNDIPNKTEKELNRIKFLRKQLGQLRDEESDYHTRRSR